MMTSLKIALKYFVIGELLAAIIIAIIHLHSYLFDAYFAYATWDVILFSAVVSGIPFGFGLYVLHEKVNLLEWLIEWKRRK